MAEKTEKLRLVTTIEGAMESVEKLGKLAKTQRDVQEQSKKLVATVRETTKDRLQEIKSIGEVTEAQAGFIGKLKQIAEVAVNATKAIAGIVRSAEEATNKASRIVKTQRVVKKQAEDLVGTIKETVKGREEEAKSIDKVTNAQARLGKSEKQPRWMVTERHVAMTDSLTKLAAIMAIVVVGGIRLRRIFQRLGRGMDRLTRPFGGLTSAIFSTVGAFRALSAVGVILKSMGRIRTAIKQEIADRLRLIEVMKIQSRAADEAVNKQLSLQDDLQRMAAQRKQGGFAGPDVAQRVASAAKRAREQFTSLSLEDVKLAYSMFGDVEGLSQRQRVELSLIAYSGGFGELGKVEGFSPKQQADWLLKRNREKTAVTARLETLQGKGPGFAEYRPAVTERAQRAAAQAKAVGGPKGKARAAMAALLPADFATVLPGKDESQIDRYLRLKEMYGSTTELEAAEIGYATPQNTMFGRVSIKTRGQVGHWNQLREWAGYPKLETFREDQWELLTRAGREVVRGATPGGIRPKPYIRPPEFQIRIDESDPIRRLFEGLKGIVFPPPVTNNTYNMQHGKWTHPSAQAQREAITNGGNYARNRGG